MSRRRLENLAVAGGIVLVILGAFLAVGQTRLWFERAEVRRSTDAMGNVFLAQEALAEVVALTEPAADIFDEPPRTNPGRGPAHNRYQPTVLKVLTGVNRGKLLLANNILHFKPSSNALLGKGSLAHVSVSTSDSGVRDVLIYKPIVRFPTLIYLVAGLTCALIFFLRSRGLALTTALVLTLLASSLILFPLILRGFSALGAVAIYAVLIMGILILFLGKAGRKGLAAILGGCGGLLVAVMVVLIASGPLKLSGFPTTFSVVLKEALGGDMELDFVSLLTCGTVVCVMGIVLDLSVGIASAVETVCLEQPHIRRSVALKSGIRMSRDVTGTMLLTLVFVWAGTRLHAMMLPWGMGISFRELLNTEAMAVEILRLTAGGIGLVSAGPITALVSVAFFARPKHFTVPKTGAQETIRQEQPRNWPLWAALGAELALCLACGMLLITSAPEHSAAGIAADEPTTPVAELQTADDCHSYAVEQLKEGHEPRAALALWRAVEIDPGHGRSRCSLAHLYANRRWFVPAHREIMQALKLLPEDSDTHYIAGVVMIWLNQPDEAERELQRALELDPNNAKASQALQWMLFGDETE